MADSPVAMRRKSRGRSTRRKSGAAFRMIGPIRKAAVKVFGCHKPIAVELVFALAGKRGPPDYSSSQSARHGAEKRASARSGGDLRLASADRNNIGNTIGTIRVDRRGGSIPFRSRRAEARSPARRNSLTSSRDDLGPVLHFRTSSLETRRYNPSYTFRRKRRGSAWRPVSIRGRIRDRMRFLSGPCAYNDRLVACDRSRSLRHGCSLVGSTGPGMQGDGQSQPMLLKR